MFIEIEQVLIDRHRIARRVREMAGAIATDLAAITAREKSSVEGRVVFVPIMTGAMIFAADLVREMPIKLSLELVAISSYPGQSVVSRGARLASELPRDLAGKHVVVIDDILDSGQTLDLVRKAILAQNAASVRLCVLLRKNVQRVVEVEPDYVGFEIPDAFVVGYGLDYDGYYRNYPEIGTLNPLAIAQHPPVT
ncbi:MAG: hypoxanthine phosphoribosyltransferase [Phycisphaeraceae bacterium]|nr:hypoxanthine phosphoribosyltransferase [Phycisphaeraceae bacterium]MCW5762752.1 hypoxanthine phosphoribosyltransferase [Phycisphaeraceae bacterium]